MYLKPRHFARRRVLVVDDDQGVRRALREILADDIVAEAGNGRIARSILTEQRLDLVITDIFMPECDGFELIAAIRAMKQPVPVIAMSDHERWTGLNFLDAANDLGAAAVIEKPIVAAALLQLIEATLARQSIVLDFTLHRGQAQRHRGSVIDPALQAEAAAGLFDQGLDDR